MFDREAHALQRMGATVVDVEAFDDEDRASALCFIPIAREPSHQCLLPM